MWCLSREFAVGEKPALELSGLSSALQQAYPLLLGFSCSEFIDHPGRTNLNCMNDMTFRFLGTLVLKSISAPVSLPLSQNRCCVHLAVLDEAPRQQNCMYLSSFLFLLAECLIPPDLFSNMPSLFFTLMRSALHGV